MSALRKNAIELVERIPEEKLYFVIQILSGVDGLYAQNDKTDKEKAFDILESIRRKNSMIDYDKELEDWREEKFGNARVG